jgi:hypothetical protein
VKYSSWSPYVLDFHPNTAIIGPHERPVAIVDTINKLMPGYKAVHFWKGNYAGMGAAFTETPVLPKQVLVDSQGNMVAVVMGIGKVFPGFKVRDITAGEAALSGDVAGIF